MIGQNYLRGTIRTQVVPPFMILVGDKGSGRKTMLKELFTKETIWFYNCKVETIRDMVELSYCYHHKLFIIPDADNMSTNAKNALLKVVEETPNDNRYIITLEDENNTLDTIKSRAQIYRMEEYTLDEISQYIYKFYGTTSTKDEIEIAKSVCNNPGEVDMLMSMNGIDFYNYVQLVVENIGTVSGANSFKIANEINLKDDLKKYDLKMFWKMFIKVCWEYKDNEMYLKMQQITSDYLKQLRISGINKQMLFDNWILDIRKELLQNG